MPSSVRTALRVWWGGVGSLQVKAGRGLQHTHASCARMQRGKSAASCVPPPNCCSPDQVAQGGRLDRIHWDAGRLGGALDPAACRGEEAGEGRVHE